MYPPELYPGPTIQVLRPQGGIGPSDHDNFHENNDHENNYHENELLSILKFFHVQYCKRHQEPKTTSIVQEHPRKFTNSLTILQILQYLQLVSRQFRSETQCCGLKCGSSLALTPLTDDTVAGNNKFRNKFNQKQMYNYTKLSLSLVGNQHCSIQ